MELNICPQCGKENKKSNRKCEDCNASFRLEAFFDSLVIVAPMTAVGVLLGAVYFFAQMGVFG